MKARSISLIGLFAFVLSNILGSGIFTTPAVMAKFGSISLFSWGLNIIGTLALIHVYLSLQQANQDADGGAFGYTRFAFGNYAAFIVVIFFWLAWCITIGAMIVSFVGYLSFYLPILRDQQSHQAWQFLAEVLLILATLMINLLGSKKMMITQIIAVFLKLVPVFIIVAIGFPYIHLDNLRLFNISSQTHFSAIMETTNIAFWTMIGFEAAIVISRQAKNLKAVSRATIYATLFMLLFYTVISFISLTIISPNTLQFSNAADITIVNHILGIHAGQIVGICVMISIFGATSAGIYLAAAVPQAAAISNVFPHYFNRLNRHHIPYIAHLSTALIVLLTCLFSLSPKLLTQFTFTLELSTNLFLIPYLFACVAIFSRYYRDRLKGNKLVFVSATISLLFLGCVLIGAGWLINLGVMIALLLTYPLYKKQLARSAKMMDQLVPVKG